MIAKVPKIEDLYKQFAKDFHPDANRMPLLSQKAFEELVEDIDRHGLRQPVQYLGGKIIDGRNRYLACRALGIDEPPPVPRRRFETIAVRRTNPSNVRAASPSTADVRPREPSSRTISSVVRVSRSAAAILLSRLTP